MIKSGKQETAFFIELKLFNHANSLGSTLPEQLGLSNMGCPAAIHNDILSYIFLEGQTFLNLVKTSVFPDQLVNFICIMWAFDFSQHY